MSITTTKLTRAAGLSAVVGGLLFIAVQIKQSISAARDRIQVTLVESFDFSESRVRLPSADGQA